MKHIKRIILIILASIAITLAMPRSGMLDFTVTRGDVWTQEALMAPFDIPLYKSVSGLDAEREDVYNKLRPVFRLDTAIARRNVAHARRMLPNLTVAVGAGSDTILSLLQYIYSKGVVAEPEYAAYTGKIALVSDRNMLTETPIAELFTPEIASRYIESRGYHAQPLISYILPNLSYDEKLNKEIRNMELGAISRTRGMVRSGDLIIAKGQVVDNETMQLVDSFKREYEIRMGTGLTYWFIMLGRFLIVLFILMINYVFFNQFASLYFGRGIKEMLFVLIMYTAMPALVGVSLLIPGVSPYVVPLPLIAIYMLTFFNMRVAILSNVTVALLGALFVRMPFEFFMVNFVGGMIAIFMMRHYYHRGNLFRAVGVIFLSEVLAYICMALIRSGDFQDINYGISIWFMLNSLLLLGFCQMVYLIERAFGFVSDITLLELCDTNQPLLLELAAKAPGTFQHSIQVANLAESAAAEIGANTLLARAGAMYHDIGKLQNPFYFVENLSGEFNPHNDLEPSQSAEVLRRHVTDGVALAKKARVPSKIIDFITGHHGTSKMYFFYSAQLNKYGEVADESAFRYPGPTPVSREVSICMMADAVEAASRSLKSYETDEIETLVNKIIDIQISEGQLNNSLLSLSEIQRIKQVMINKILDIYHTRIAYPERGGA